MCNGNCTACYQRADILYYLNEYIQKSDEDILKGAKRLRYTIYNPKGEDYVTVGIEYYGMNAIILYKFKFNDNYFVGNQIDCKKEIFHSWKDEKLRSALKSSPYHAGTGMGKFIYLDKM